jgi:hypothetical protein
MLDIMLGSSIQPLISFLLTRKNHHIPTVHSSLFWGSRWWCVGLVLTKIPETISRGNAFFWPGVLSGTDDQRTRPVPAGPVW